MKHLISQLAHVELLTPKPVNVRIKSHGSLIIYANRQK